MISRLFLDARDVTEHGDNRRAVVIGDPILRSAPGTELILTVPLGTFVASRGSDSGPGRGA